MLRNHAAPRKLGARMDTIRSGMTVLLACGVMISALDANADRRAGLFHAARLPGLDATDLRRAQGGEAVTRTLESGDAREVVVIGAIALPVSRQSVVASLRDIMFTTSAVVPQLGRFSAQPSVADLDALTIDASDLDDLRECQIARCKIHLPADTVRALEGLNGNGDGNSQGLAADERRTRLFKQFLHDRTRAYLATGRSALAPYAQRAGVNGPAADIDSLLTASVPYLALAPAVARHLREFPSRSSEVDDALYWTKEQFGWKPVIRVTHFAIGPVSPGNGEPIVAGALQIYASHYVDASLSLVVLLGNDQPGQDCQVIYVSRARMKATAGRFGGITRRVIESRARDALRRFLETLKTRSTGTARPS
jgi:hypothetical protein